MYRIVLVFCFVVCVVQWIDGAQGDITTVAGGGVNDGALATEAGILGPMDVTFDAQGNMYVVEYRGARVRKVDVGTGRISTIAGTGVTAFEDGGAVASQTNIFAPHSIDVDQAGNVYFDSIYLMQIDASGQMQRFAGRGVQLGDGVFATDAAGSVRSVFIDQANDFYVSMANRVRRIDPTTRIIETVAGQIPQSFEQALQPGFSGDGGPAIQAQLHVPRDIWVTEAGHIYFCDQRNHRVRRIDAQTGIITTVAGNGVQGYNGDGILATQASLDRARHVYVDPDENIFIADGFNYRVRRVDGQTGIITTYAGNGLSGFSGDGGPASRARVTVPHGLWGDGMGNLYIADRGNNRIRKVDAHGMISTVAGGMIGDGMVATDVTLTVPFDTFVDEQGDIYIAERTHERIRKVDAQTGLLSTVAGGGSIVESGVLARDALLGRPTGLFMDGAGRLFFSDTENHRVRMIDATGRVVTIAGTGSLGYSGDGGQATQAQLNFPMGIFIDQRGDVYFAERDNHCVRKVDGETGIISTVAGNGIAGFAGDNRLATEDQLNEPWDVFVEKNGDVYIADRFNHRVRKVDGETGMISTIAGNGIREKRDGDGQLVFEDYVPATHGLVREPTSVFVDDAGILFIAEFKDGRDGRRIRKVDLNHGIFAILETVAGTGDRYFRGDDVPATGASLYSPSGVFVDGMGHLFITDIGNRRVRKVEGIAAPTSLDIGIYQGPTFPLLHPVVEINQSSIQLGQVDIVGTWTRTLELKNVGAEVLHVSGMTSSVAGLDIIPTTFDLQPLESKMLTVTFVPQLEGTIEGQLELTSNDPNQASLVLPISGTVVNIPADPRADFNGDRQIDMADFVNLADAFGSARSDFDLDDNGQVNFQDFLMFVQSFGKTVP